MRFYYTGAQDFLNPQTDPNLSLGGYISSTVIPNDAFNTVIPNLSERAIDIEKPFCNLIVLKNELGVDLANLKFWVEYSQVNPSVKIQVAFVTPSYKDFVNKRKYYFESIDNSESAPYLGTFNSIEGELNKVTILPSFVKDAYLGIWIKRIIQKDTIRPVADACVVAPLEAGIKESFMLKFDWD